MKEYPTKTQVLTEPRPNFKRGLMDLVSEWKKEFYGGWEQEFEETQMLGLAVLSLRICALYNVGLVDVTIGEVDSFSPKEQHIYLTKPSVITMLHELAHHLFGPDELQACRWSVWIYQLRFRNDYNKLVWDQHRIVRPSSRKAKQSK